MEYRLFFQQDCADTILRRENRLPNDGEIEKPIQTQGPRGMDSPRPFSISSRPSTTVPAAIRALFSSDEQGRLDRNVEIHLVAAFVDTAFRSRLLAVKIHLYYLLVEIGIVAALVDDLSRLL